jgi:hypothetical protein
MRVRTSCLSSPPLLSPLSPLASPPLLSIPPLFIIFFPNLFSFLFRTLHYASPDILTEGEGYNGRLHDVWSAGVNLFVMVTVRSSSFFFFPLFSHYTRSHSHLLVLPLFLPSLSSIFSFFSFFSSNFSPPRVNFRSMTTIPNGYYGRSCQVPIPIHLVWIYQKS